MEIAIDIGYGYTKVKTNGTEFKFPTAVELAKTQMVETDTYIFEGKKFYVGEDATRNALLTRDYEFLYKYAPLLIAESLKMANIDFNDAITIKTGLSLYDLEKAAIFDKDAVNRRDEFSKRISKFYVNDQEYKFNIKLFAQGQGIWQDYCLDNGIIEDGYDVVVDIGYRTNDVIVFKNGKTNRAESSADDKGINQITTELQTIINKRFDVVLTEQEVATILKNKYITISGAKKDLTNLIFEVVEGYIESFFNLLKAKHGNILKIAQRVIISGGGAYIIQEYAQALPGNVVFSQTPLEYANVRGYYNA
ncbi:ParM/StbA family protein [Aliarcobacter lanthieri]|uniref:ParM/StbA family protein n=1 Tax=Aliarcobacter lanthieri TaxID=1355374 RepID=UPI003AAD1420